MPFNSIVKAKDYDRVRETEMPLKAGQVQVVICGPLEEYGRQPLDETKETNCLRDLLVEYNRTSGRVPYKFKDLRQWKKNGILMLDSSTRDMRNVLHFLRFLSLTKKNIIFVFVEDEQCKYLSTLLSDLSDETNHYLWYPSFKQSNMFKHVESIRKFLDLKPVKWNPVI